MENLYWMRTVKPCTIEGESVKRGALSFMNIDPRTLKELLQLQLMNRVDLLASSTNATNTSDSDFSGLLNDMLSQNVSGNLGSLQTAAGKTALKPMSVSPLFASASSYAQNEKAAGAVGLEPLIQEASRRHGVESSLVKAVIDAESSFNSKAVSGAGAKGLMQLMDATGKGLGVTDPFDPEQNIQGGTKYLSNLIRKYDGNQGVALAAYNAGSGRVDRLGITNDKDLVEKLDQLPKETQQYVTKVLNLQRTYEG
jgi:soluble lytic murein transglycosylase-like protein